MTKKHIFWVDGYAGRARGGYFIRGRLAEFLAELCESGETPVGIAVEEGENLIEVIVAARQDGQEGE